MKIYLFETSKKITKNIILFLIWQRVTQISALAIRTSGLLALWYLRGDGVISPDHGLRSRWPRNLPTRFSPGGWSCADQIFHLCNETHMPYRIKAQSLFENCPIGGRAKHPIRLGNWTSMYRSYIASSVGHNTRPKSHYGRYREIMGPRLDG